MVIVPQVPCTRAYFLFFELGVSDTSMVCLFFEPGSLQGMRLYVNEALAVIALLRT